MSGSLIFRTVYGYHVQESQDPYIEAADEMMAAAEYAVSGGWIVDYLPLRTLSSAYAHRPESHKS